MPKIAQTRIRAWRVVVPPIVEQSDIVAYIDDAAHRLEQVTGRERRVIQLLHELRARLISDVVTGKLDVREVAASLPEVPEVDEAEPLDEEEVVEATEDISEEALDAISEEAAL